MNKVCIVSTSIPPEFAGAGKRALRQAEYFNAKKSIVVSLLTTTQKVNLNGGLDIIVFPVPNFFKNQNKVSKIKMYLYLPVLYFRLKKLIRQTNIELFHCIPGASWIMIFITYISKKFDKKVVLECTLLGSDDPLSIEKSYLGKIKLSIFKSADAIINISPLLMEASMKAKIDESKVFLIPNSVDTTVFSPCSEDRKQNLRIKYNYTEFDTIFLYAGIVRKRKNVKFVVDAFSRYHSKHPKSCLIIAGPTDKDEENRNYTNELKIYIERIGIENNIIFTGEVNTINEYMQLSDIFLFASVNEGFGNVIIEAMSCGLPTICLEIDKITDYIITNNKDGFIIKNESEMYERMLELGVEYKKRLLISINAREKVLSTFSDEEVMKDYETLYKKILFDKNRIN